MKVLVACEYSGTVRDAFLSLGIEEMSCDLLPTDKKGPHYQGDVRDILYDQGWTHMIAHVPCTNLAVSGARWFKDKADLIERDLNFAREILDAPIPHIALENPVSLISSRIRKPDQYIQPWMFGHGETKKTGLWLKNLPKLLPTDVVDGREPRVHMMPPSKDRWKLRSTTYQGIADAMAMQWGLKQLAPV